jgi:hypothetical protein
MIVCTTRVETGETERAKQRLWRTLVVRYEILPSATRSGYRGIPFASYAFPSSVHFGPRGPTETSRSSCEQLQLVVASWLKPVLSRVCHNAIAAQRGTISFLIVTAVVVARLPSEEVAPRVFRQWRRRGLTVHRSILLLTASGLTARREATCK